MPLTALAMDGNLFRSSCRLSVANQASATLMFFSSPHLSLQNSLFPPLAAFICLLFLSMRTVLIPRIIFFGGRILGSRDIAFCRLKYPLPLYACLVNYWLTSLSFCVYMFEYFVSCRRHDACAVVVKRARVRMREEKRDGEVGDGAVTRDSCKKRFWWGSLTHRWGKDFHSRKRWENLLTTLLTMDSQFTEFFSFKLLSLSPTHPRSWVTANYHFSTQQNYGEESKISMMLKINQKLSLKTHLLPRCTKWFKEVSNASTWFCKPRFETPL